MSLALKPTHAAVKNYYAALTQVGLFHFNDEAQVSDAFAKLLIDCGRKLHLTFIPQFPIQRAKTRVVVDGALLDTFNLAHGYWEAKDEKDDLDREIKAKLDKGYPRDNIIFQLPNGLCSTRPERALPTRTSPNPTTSFNSSITSSTTKPSHRGVGTGRQRIFRAYPGTLSGIPKETYDYRLGNRSALE